MRPRQIDQWLQEGLLAAKEGRLETARSRLLDVVEQDQTNEIAWYWLYRVSNREDDKRICLENLIIINSQNLWAKQELLNYLDTSAIARVQASQASPQPVSSARPIPAQKNGSAQRRSVNLKLVIAFWLGISIIFLGGGIISAGEWLTSSLNDQVNTEASVAVQLVEPSISLIFIVAGVIGLYVAISLYLQSMFGFYGSIFYALGLLLIGPIVSLITTPPNYLSMVCTGGISGMIVLLTLASQPEAESSSNNESTSN